MLPLLQLISRLMRGSLHACGGRERALIFRAGRSYPTEVFCGEIRHEATDSETVYKGPPRSSLRNRISNARMGP